MRAALPTATNTCYSMPLLLTPVSAAKAIAAQPMPAPIPAYPSYVITRCGKVYRDGYPLQCIRAVNRCPRVRLSKNGKTSKIAVARLVAITYVDNPNNYRQYIHKDRDPDNCQAANLVWVSNTEYRHWKANKRIATSGERHYDYEELLGPVKRKKEKPVIALGGVPVSDFPGYFITREGVVYKTDRIIAHMKGNRGCLRVKLRYPTDKKEYLRAGLATLVAEHFVANPKKHRHVIFKDVTLNCHADNLAWVDGETFMYWSGAYRYQGSERKKKRLPREEAIRICKDPLLKRYYETLDDYYLQELWLEIDKRVTERNMRDWEQLRSDTYLYFTERCQRFSFVHDPLPILMLYLRNLKRKLREEISPDIPVSKLFASDETLRNGQYRGADRSGNWQSMGGE